MPSSRKSNRKPKKPTLAQKARERIRSEQAGIDLDLMHQLAIAQVARMFAAAKN